MEMVQSGKRKVDLYFQNCAVSPCLITASIIYVCFMNVSF